MRRPGLSVAVLALSLLLLTGCGGGDDGDDTTAATALETTEATAALSKEELISQGDGICAEVNAAVGTVGSTSSSGEGQAAQVAGLYGGMVDRLKDLGAPSDDSAGYAEFISAAEALAQAEENVKLDSERKEEGESLAEAETALDSFQSAASSFGFEDCAEAPAAPVPGGSVGEAGEEAVEGAEEEGGVEVAPEEEAEVAPEEAAPVEEEGAGGGAGVGGGTEGGGTGSGGGESGGVGPG